jgi:hypothetical protein
MRPHAWTEEYMPDIKRAREALVRRVLEGAGKVSISDRRAAFNNSGLSEPLNALVDKIATRAHTITDEDISAARMAGLSEDQVFEIAVCAAVGQASRQYETALGALETATGKN